MKICPNCKTEYGDDFSFCGKCGSALLQKVETFFCPYCGKRLEGKMTFCPYCGGNLNVSNISNQTMPNQAGNVQVGNNTIINNSAPLVCETQTAIGNIPAYNNKFWGFFGRINQNDFINHFMKAFIAGYGAVILLLLNVKSTSLMVLLVLTIIALIFSLIMVGLMFRRFQDLNISYLKTLAIIVIGPMIFGFLDTIIAISLGYSCLCTVYYAIVLIYLLKARSKFQIEKDKALINNRAILSIIVVIIVLAITNYSYVNMMLNRYR
jgi:uncharacterized membrane protein YhaH (DUF805 family)